MIFRYLLYLLSNLRLICVFFSSNSLKLENWTRLLHTMIQNLLKSKAMIHSVSVIFTVLAYLVKYATSSAGLKATISSLKNLMNLLIINMKKWDSLILKKHQHRMINHLCLYCDKSEHQTAICNSKLKIQLQIISLFAFAISINNLTFDTSFALRKV